MCPVGSGCGSIGTAVACNTRDPQFEPRNRQNLSANLSTNCIKEKTKIKKEARNGPPLNKITEVSRILEHNSGETSQQHCFSVEIKRKKGNFFSSFAICAPVKTDAEIFSAAVKLRGELPLAR